MYNHLMMCKESGCVSNVAARGLCSKHYQKRRRKRDLPPTTTRADPALSLAEVLMSYCTQSPDGCWEWKPRSRVRGYGVLEYKGRRLLAHRASFLVFVGPLEDWEVVRHHCDNPPCIRPDHLVKGTQAENMRDAIERRRTATGSRVASSKLSEAQVVRIREQREAGASYAELCEEHGIGMGTLSALINRKTWRHV